MDAHIRTQLRLISEVAELMKAGRVRFWLRGGWALDFLLGRVTRSHGDIDLVARLHNRGRVRAALESARYRVVRDDELGSFHMEKDGQDVGVAFIMNDEQARIITPGKEFWPWPDDSFPDTLRRLEGIACRTMSPSSLLEEKVNYERYSQRPLRPKDIESIRLLRELLASGR